MTDYSLMGVITVTWPFLNFAPIISLKWVSYALQISCTEWYIEVLVHARSITQKGMFDVSRDLLKFWETSDNISLTVQDRNIAAVEY